MTAATPKKVNIHAIAFVQELQRRFDTVVVQEYQFHPKRKWRVDFYLPQFGIAIELEGGVWSSGRHTRGSGYIADIEKYNEITAAGLMLIRVTYATINKRATFDLIERCISNTREKLFN